MLNEEDRYLVTFFKKSVKVFFALNFFYHIALSHPKAVFDAPADRVKYKNNICASKIVSLLLNKPLGFSYII